MENLELSQSSFQFKSQNSWTPSHQDALQSQMQMIEPQTTKLLRAYKQNFLHQFHDMTQSCKRKFPEQSQEQINLVRSLLLKGSLKGIKVLDVMNVPVLDAGGNKNKKQSKKELKQKTMEKEKKYLLKLQSRKPTIYRLIHFDGAKIIPFPSSVKEKVWAQFVHQMIQEGFRFKKCFPSNYQEGTLAQREDYLRQQRLNSKFAGSEMQPLKPIFMSVDISLGNVSDKFKSSLVNRFYRSIECNLDLAVGLVPAIGDTYFRNRNKKRSVFKLQELNTKLSQSMLALTCVADARIRLRPNTNQWEDSFRIEQNEIINACQVHNSELKAHFAINKTQRLSEFKRLFENELGIPQCQITAQQIEKHKHQRQQILAKLTNHKNQHLAAQITGGVMYEVEEKVRKISKTDKMCLKIALRIIEGRRHGGLIKKETKFFKAGCPKGSIKSRNSGLNVRQSVVVFNQPSMEKIRKIKMPYQDAAHRPLSKIGGEKRLGHVDNIFQSYDNRNRKNVKDQKKQELNEYINKLCRKSSPILPRGGSRVQLSSSSSVLGRKYRKYNKYPLRFGDNVEFRSERPEDCSIVYRVEDITIKELTLKYMKDRRRWGVNNVIIRLRAGKTAREEEKKAVRVQQILSCLGAMVRVEQANNYSIADQNQSSIIQLVSFSLGENVQKIWREFKAVAS